MARHGCKLHADGGVSGIFSLDGTWMPFADPHEHPGHRRFADVSGRSEQRVADAAGAGGA